MKTITRQNSLSILFLDTQRLFGVPFMNFLLPPFIISHSTFRGNDFLLYRLNTQRTQT